MAVHVAYMEWKQIGPTGTIVSKNGPIKDMLTASGELRVMEDATIPNTSGSPTLKAYLELEEGDTFRVGFLTNTIIVTYD